MPKHPDMMMEPLVDWLVPEAIVMVALVVVTVGFGVRPSA
jgi:hypothetical protein